MLNTKILEFLRQEATDRFLRYVKVGTGSDENAKNCPSTPGQLELARLIEAEMKGIGLADITLDDNGYLYAVVPKTEGAGGLMFHSKTEWIPVIALQKGAETILHLCELWSEN